MTQPILEQGNAVVMDRYGPPEVLRFAPVRLAPLAADEIRIRTIASAVNHSDLEIRAGNWPIRRDPPFPYTPGLEVVGEVADAGAAVTDFRTGDGVITVMQGLGGVRARRPGGYAEYVTVAASAAAPLPAGVDPLDMAALGLGAVTAFGGLFRIGPLGGKRIVVTGASGGVGSAGVGIARAQGGTVIGVVSRPERASYVRSLGAQEVFTSEQVTAGALGEETIDGVLDNVAGPLFFPCVKAIRPGGTLSLVGAVGGGEVSLDAYYLLEATLTGYGSEHLDGPGLRHAIQTIGDWLRSGALTPPARQVFRLAEAAAAHELLEHRGVEGRVLLVP